MLARTRRLVAYANNKTFHFTVRKGQCTVTVRKHLPKRFSIQFAEASSVQRQSLHTAVGGAAQTTTSWRCCMRSCVALGTVQCCALCSAGCSVAPGSVQCYALCSPVHCVALGAVQCCALCNAGRRVALGAVLRWVQCSAARCICAVLEADASAYTFGSVSRRANICALHSPPRGSRCCTGSASLNAAQCPRLPLRSASPAEGLLPRAQNATIFLTVSVFEHFTHLRAVVDAALAVLR